MIEVTRKADNRLDITVSGKIDKDGMEQGLDAFVEASKNMADGRLFYTITDFQFPNAAAIGVELKRLPALFSLIGKYRKAAIVSDAAWIRKFAEIEAMMIPGLTIKSFETGEEEAAEQWLAS